jgi:hypothetical protein
MQSAVTTVRRDRSTLCNRNGRIGRTNVSLRALRSPDSIAKPNPISLADQAHFWRTPHRRRPDGGSERCHPRARHPGLAVED